MRYVGLVRNVMQGREGLHRDVLLRLLDEAGGRSGASHLTTGNLTFDAAPARLDAVVRRLEDGIAGVIGRRVPVIVRGAALAPRPRRCRSVRRPSGWSSGNSRWRSWPRARSRSIPPRCPGSRDSRRSPSGRTSC